MKVTEQFVESWDGTRLFYRAWLPDRPARKALILFHRGHEHSARWEEFVRDIDLPDVAIFAWDARGHGRSDGERGFARSVNELVRDVDVFARHIWREYELRPQETIVLAHSLSAVIVGTWIHDYAPKLKAMILATAALRVKLYVPFALPALRLRHRLLGDPHRIGRPPARHCGKVSGLRSSRHKPSSFAPGACHPDPGTAPLGTEPL